MNDVARLVTRQDSVDVKGVKAIIDSTATDSDSLYEFQRNLTDLLKLQYAMLSAIPPVQIKGVNYGPPFVFRWGMLCFLDKEKVRLMARKHYLHIEKGGLYEWTLYGQRPSLHEMVGLVADVIFDLSQMFEDAVRMPSVNPQVSVHFNHGSGPTTSTLVSLYYEA